MGEPAAREDGRLVPLQTSCLGLDARFFYGTEMQGRKQSKKTFNSAHLQMSPRMASPRQGNVFVLLPYSQSFTDGQGQVISLRQAIMDVYNNKNGLKSQKQIQCKFKINSSRLQYQSSSGLQGCSHINKMPVLKAVVHIVHSIGDLLVFPTIEGQQIKRQDCAGFEVRKTWIQF